MNVNSVIELMKKSGHPGFLWLADRSKETGMSIEMIASSIFMMAIDQYAEEGRTFRRHRLRNQDNIEAFLLLKPDTVMPEILDETPVGALLAKISQ